MTLLITETITKATIRILACSAFSHQDKQVEARRPNEAGFFFPPASFFTPKRNAIFFSLLPGDNFVGGVERRFGRGSRAPHRGYPGNGETSAHGNVQSRCVEGRGQSGGGRLRSAPISVRLGKSVACGVMELHPNDSRVLPMHTARGARVFVNATTR